jgi:hypothetical protein
MERTNNVRSRTVSNAATWTEEARVGAAALVRREEYRVGSRMLAYHNVGAMIGASGAWVRKFVKGYAEVGISFPVGMNIITLYQRLCERIEADAERRLERANAADQSDREVDQSLACRVPVQEEVE